MQYQHDIEVLSKLDNYALENIFPVDQDANTYYYYNLLNKISFPDDLNKSLYTIENINFNQPLTTISFNHYGTIKLWWLILIVNKIQNPFISGVHPVKVIKYEYLDTILNLIHEQL